MEVDGGKRGYAYEGTRYSGADGTSYGNGGVGGKGSIANNGSSAGSNGWVYIEYGGDI